MLIVGAIELGDKTIPGRLRLIQFSSYVAADLNAVAQASMATARADCSVEDRQDLRARQLLPEGDRAICAGVIELERAPSQVDIKDGNIQYVDVLPLK